MSDFLLKFSNLQTYTVQDRNNINQKILQYAIIFLPPALISGPFLPDLIVVISGIYFIAFLWKSNQIHFIKNDLSKIFLVFYFYIVVNSFFADDIIMSLKNSFFYIRFLILIFLIKYLIIREKSFLKFFFYSSLFSFSILVVDGLIEYHLGFHWLFEKSSYPEFLSSKRISSLFDEEYIMGGYLLKFYPIILSLILIIFNKDNKLYILISIITFLALIGILISGERTSLFLFLLIIITYFLFLGLIQNIKKRILIVFSTLTLSALIVLFNQQLSNRLIFHTLNSFLSDASFTFDFENSEERLKDSIELYLGHSNIDYTKDVVIIDNDDDKGPFISEWNLDVPKPNKFQIIEAKKIIKKKLNEKNKIIYNFEQLIFKFNYILSRKDKKLVYFSTEHQNHALIGIHMFKENPIFGHGLKMFRVKCSEKKYYLGERSCTTHPHNTLITFISELGIIGLLFYLSIVYLILKTMYKKNDIKKIIPISLLIYILPIVPSGYFFNNHASIMFYIGVGLYLGINKIKFDEIN